MADPLKKTFDFLATSANEHALETLIHALDVPVESIQSHSVASLLKRRHHRGQTELIRRFHTLSEEMRGRVEDSARRMQAPLRNAVEHGDGELRENALRIIENGHAFSQIGTLLKVAAANAHDPQPDGRRAMQTLRVLVERLHELTSDGETSPDGPKKSTQRSNDNVNAVNELLQAVPQLVGSPLLDEAVEALLILGMPDHDDIRALLKDEDSEAARTAWKILPESSHPGVMQFVVCCFSLWAVPNRIVEIVERRDDPEFILHLLRWLPEKPSVKIAANLRRIKQLAWIDADDPQLEWIPPGLQGNLLTLIAGSGLPSHEKLAVQQWTIRHGSVIGRMAAVELLASSASEHDRVERAVSEALVSDDAEVQAWATSQLREYQIPETFSLLIERLDSPLEEVQEAARDELQSFDLARMLELFDDLEPEICLRAGELIEKIDPTTTEQLEQELASPIRTRRIRAVRAARAIGLHPLVIPSLLDLLDDDDQTILRAVIDALSELPLPEVRSELQRMADHESPRIQEAARDALQFHDALLQQPPANVSPVPDREKQ